MKITKIYFYRKSINETIQNHKYSKKIIYNKLSILSSLNASRLCLKIQD